MDIRTSMMIALNASMTMRPRQVPPSAWIGHLPFAFWVIEEARPRIVVELGSHNGTSYLAFCQAVARCALDTKCFAVDTWQGDEHSGFYGDEVFQALAVDNAAHYGGFSQLMRMTFDEALAYFADGSVDLLHIDGLHTYEAVKHDFESWLPKMSERGVVLFHDTMVRERNFGVWKLWAELRGRYPGFEFQHTHGLGVLLVGTHAPTSLHTLAALSGTADEVSVLRLFEALGDRIYASERAHAAEANLARALQDAQRSMEAAQSAHAYMDGRIRDLEAGEAGLKAALQSERETAVAAGDALQRLEAAQAEMLARNEALAVESVSLVERTGALETERASLIDRLGALEAERTSQIDHIGALEAERRTLIERNDALEGERAPLIERNGALEAERTSLIDRIDVLQVERASLIDRADALEAEHAGLTGRFHSLEIESGRMRELLEAAEARCEVEVARFAELTGEMRRDAVAHTAALEEAHDRLAANDLEHRRRLTEREAELDAKRVELDRMLHSKSWALTAPLRRLAALLRGA